MGRLRDIRKQGKTEEAEEFLLVIDKRHKFHGNILTVNSKLGRIVLSSQAYQYAVEHYGKDFEQAQLLYSQKTPNTFIIRPCEKGIPGARGVHIASGSRVISAKLLLQTLEWTSEGGVHFAAEWIENLKALRVDLNKPLEA